MTYESFLPQPFSYLGEGRAPCDQLGAGWASVGRRLGVGWAPVGRQLSAGWRRPQ
jgi:hypothetical protein